MTATAIEPSAVICPKCAGPVWDQRGSKFWGNGLFKSGKQKPRWECKNKECGGAVWDKSSPAPAPAKAPPASFANKPESEISPLLRNAESEDAAELQAKIAGDTPDPRDARKEAYAGAQYQSVKIALDVLEPLFKAKGIGMTDETVHKLSYELFRTWTDKGLVG